MNQRLLSALGRSQRLPIVNLLKRSRGLAVKELADRLKMSYMGVKQHCLALERLGYVDTWRRPGPVGRPEKVYRLTRLAHDLFPHAANRATLELLAAAKTLFGATAPEKLLFVMFQQETARYGAAVRGDTPLARARWLARVRDREGYMADFETAGGPRIVECHSPILDLLRSFPAVARFERELFERVIGAPVQREETSPSGLYRCEFRIGAG